MTYFAKNVKAKNVVFLLRWRRTLVRYEPMIKQPSEGA